MAFSQTAVITRTDGQGRRFKSYHLTGTSVSSSTEFSMVGVPLIGTITLVEADITAGDAAAAGTLQLSLGKESGFSASTTNYIGQSDTAQAYVYDTSPRKYSLVGGSGIDDDDVTGTMYGKTGISTGSNNTVQIIITIMEGH